MSKEIQLSLSFCGALAALLLISAPVSETASLVGSGSAFFVAGEFFYGGIRKYFSDKAKQLAAAEQRVELSHENFTFALNQLVQHEEKISGQLQDIVAVINGLNSQLAHRDEQLVAQLNDIINVIEDLIDSVKPLGEMSETLTAMKDRIEKLTVVARAIEDNSNQFNDLLKATKKVADNLEDVADNVEKISSIKDGLQELSNVINRQEEFYKTTLNQYKSMSDKDVELIETLARKLR